MPSSHTAGDGTSTIQWSKDTMDTRPEEEEVAIRVLNNAFRSVSARKLGMVSVLDEDPPPSSAASRYISASPLRDKPKGRGGPQGTYQGSAAASLSNMLIDGAYDESSDSDGGSAAVDAEPPRGRRAAANSRRTSKTGFRDATAPDAGGQQPARALLFGPPDPSIYSPGSEQQLPLPRVPTPPTNPRGESPQRPSIDGPPPPPDADRSSLSKILDKFVSEEESGPIIRNKNYTGTAQQGGRRGLRDRSPSAPRISSLASMAESYSSPSRNASRNSRGRGEAVSELDAAADEDGGAARCTSAGAAGSDMFAAASELALSAMPRAPPQPRAARPSLDAVGEAWRSSCGSVAAHGGGRPEPLGVTSSLTDLPTHDDAREGKPLLVFSSVSALPPLGQHSATPPRPRQLRALGGSSPSTPPQQPAEARVLSRHASPSRGAAPPGGMAPRDPSPARPVPRLAGSRDASPTVPRPLAPTEIVAAAVAQIAAASHHYHQHGSSTNCSSPPPSNPTDQVRSGMTRPPKHAQAASGGGAAARPAAPSSWDVALRDSSPSRPASRSTTDDQQEQQPQQPQQPQQRERAAPLLRSRDNSPLRSAGLSASAADDVDPETLAEMMSGNIAWRLPMRMGVPSRSSNGGGRTSRDASPNSRGMRSLTEEPPAPAPAPLNKPPKMPLTKPANWGRGGDPGRGHAPASNGGSGLGNTLPHLVQSHVFMEPGGKFDIVHELHPAPKH